jgi:hypothetical protein
MKKFKRKIQKFFKRQKPIEPEFVEIVNSQFDKLTTPTEKERQHAEDDGVNYYDGDDYYDTE